MTFNTIINGRIWKYIKNAFQKYIICWGSTKIFSKPFLTQVWARWAKSGSKAENALKCLGVELQIGWVGLVNNRQYITLMKLWIIDLKSQFWYISLSLSSRVAWFEVHYCLLGWFDFLKKSWIWFEGPKVDVIHKNKIFLSKEISCQVVSFLSN